MAEPEDRSQEELFRTEPVPGEVGSGRLHPVATRRIDQQGREGNGQKGTISSSRWAGIGRRVGIESRILAQFSSVRTSAPYSICSLIHRIFPDPTADSRKYKWAPKA